MSRSSFAPPPPTSPRTRHAVIATFIHTEIPATHTWPSKRITSPNVAVPRRVVCADRHAVGPAAMSSTQKINIMAGFALRVGGGRTEGAAGEEAGGGFFCVSRKGQQGDFCQTATFGSMYPNCPKISYRVAGWLDQTALVFIRSTRCVSSSTQTLGAFPMDPKPDPSTELSIAENWSDTRCARLILKAPCARSSYPKPRAPER